MRRIVLPPFHGSLACADSADRSIYGVSYSHRGSTGAILDWKVQEKRGMKLRHPSGLSSCGVQEVYNNEKTITASTVYGTPEPSQCGINVYRPPRIVLPSFDYRDDSSGDDGWVYGNRSVVGQSATGLSPTDPRTTGFENHRGISWEHDNRTELSPDSGSDDFPVDGGWLFPEAHWSSLELDALERREGSNSGSIRTERCYEGVHSHWEDRHKERMLSRPYRRPTLITWDPHRAHTGGGHEPSVVEAYHHQIHMSPHDQYHYRNQEIASNDAARFDDMVRSSPSDADYLSIASVSAIENIPEGPKGIWECEPSHSSNSSPGQSPQEIHRDTIRAPSFSAELVHGQLGDLTTGGPEALPLLPDQFGNYNHANPSSAIVLHTDASNPDRVNYSPASTAYTPTASPPTACPTPPPPDAIGQIPTPSTFESRSSVSTTTSDCSKGGLGLAASKNNGMRSKLSGMKSRISSRLRRL